MTDDTRGDDLFEDLDKFFAPIKDVEWDEPEEPAAQAPQEEHVAVVGGSSSEVDHPEPVEAVDDDAGSEGHGSSAVDDVTIIDDVPDEGSAEAEPTGSLDPEEVQAARGGFWGERDEPVAAAETASSEGDGGDELPFDDEPSADELEAAAEHFADTVRSERYDTEPVDLTEEPMTKPGGEAPPDDLAADRVEQEILADLDEPPDVSTVIVGAEGISGPSWQEPASVEVGADLDRRDADRGERDVPVAFLTGTVLAGVAVGSLLIGPAAFATVATVVVLLAQGELYGVMVRRHHQPATAVGLTTGALIMIGSYQRGVEAIPAMFALGLVATFLWYLTVPAMQRKDMLSNAALTIVNIAWIPVLAAYLTALSTRPDGTSLVIAVVGLTYLYDTAAFMAGTVLGGAWFRRGMAPATSPKKSWEGLLIAAIFTVFVAAAIVTSFVGPFNDRQLVAVLLALVVVAGATLGDLAESLIKRDLDVKDMSTVLPGHGGVLDRIDSLLFVAPLAYLLLGAADIL